MQPAGELRLEPHVRFEGGAEVQDGVTSIAPRRVQQRIQSERFVHCRRNLGFSRSTQSHGMLRRKFSLQAAGWRTSLAVGIRPYPRSYPV